MLLSSCWSDRYCYPLMWKIAVSNGFMDLQKYPRNRKSKKKKPEALDSKICSTFPVMAGSSLVRMPDQQLLPLQFFFLFFVPKGFNWGTSPHWSREHCDGSQWAPARGTGTGTARLRVTCIFKAASGILYTWMKMGKTVHTCLNMVQTCLYMFMHVHKIMQVYRHVHKYVEMYMTCT